MKITALYVLLGVAAVAALPPASAAPSDAHAVFRRSCDLCAPEDYWWADRPRAVATLTAAHSRPASSRTPARPPAPSPASSTARPCTSTAATATRSRSAAPAATAAGPSCRACRPRRRPSRSAPTRATPTPAARTSPTATQRSQRRAPCGPAATSSRRRRGCFRCTRGGRTHARRQPPAADAERDSGWMAARRTSLDACTFRRMSTVGCVAAPNPRRCRWHGRPISARLPHCVLHFPLSRTERLRPKEAPYRSHSAHAFEPAGFPNFIDPVFCPGMRMDIRVALVECIQKPTMGVT
ncbi:hypothetical protein DFJ74DRAFT_345044 [Hyaloraphidium curvatum]|nr:hypothetical protein DFJ74DRAFT_345044 [Hyaloraphidium curvatum]